MSKKQKFQKIIAGVFLLALLVGMLPVTSVNAASKPKALPSVSGKSNKIVKIDMTGNGKKNTVKLITTPDPADDFFTHSFKITVDGKTALSMKNIDKYSPKVLEQLCNACFRRSSFTSEFCQDYISVETHRDGWYIIVEGLRSGCSFFLNKNYEVIRKPRGSKALYKTAVSNCSYFNWRTLLDMKKNIS